MRLGAVASGGAASMHARSSAGTISSSSRGDGASKGRFAGLANGHRLVWPTAAISPRRWRPFCRRRVAGSRREPSALRSSCTASAQRNANGSSSGFTVARLRRSHATSSSVGPPRRASRTNPSDAPAAIVVRVVSGGAVPIPRRRQGSVEWAASAVRDATGGSGRPPETRQRQVRSASRRRLSIASRRPWMRCDAASSAMTPSHRPRW